MTITYTTMRKEPGNKKGIREQEQRNEEVKKPKKERHKIRTRKSRKQQERNKAVRKHT